MISADKVKKQISLDKNLAAAAELQADKEIRTLSNLITIALTEYLERVKESNK